jgi:hypothetical protein
MRIPNIGPRGQTRRMTLGLVFFGVAVLLGVLLFVIGAARGWRLALLGPLWIGALCIFQALDKT